jgi:hypothetical protein
VKSSKKESLLFTTPDERLFANRLLPISSSRLPTSYPKIQHDKLAYQVELSMSPNLSFSLKSRQTFSFLLMYL